MSAPSKPTIISIAILAMAAAATAHEGAHALTSWLRGDIPTQLTSNHLSDLHPDRWVAAAGPIVNLILGPLALLAARAAGLRANLRYFLAIFGAFNLLDGAGYFLFSGILGVGDWQQVLHGLPHYVALRILISVAGAALYVLAVRAIAHALAPFCPTRRLYNTIGRLPYCAACLFYCFAGAFDPLGIHLLFISTIPAALGGLSGLLWADAFLKRTPGAPTLTIHRQPAWWVAALILGLAFILILGRGIRFAH